MPAGLAPKRSMAAAAMLTAFGLSACASIERTPDRADIAELVLVDQTCRVEDGKPCKAEEKAEKVVVNAMECRRLPLRAGVPEVARAECTYEATVTRVNGTKAPLGPRTAEFGLINYSPGARLGVYQWSKKPDQPPSAEALATTSDQ